MAWVVLATGLVAILQGAAWLGPRKRRPRALAGATLATLGVLAFGLSLLHLCAPGFFAR